MSKKIVLMVVLFFQSLVLLAQTEKKIEHQSLLWTRYYNQLTLNEKYSLHTEVDNRVFLNSFKQNLFVSRMQLRRKANENVEFGLGFAYFSVATQSPNQDFGFKTPEYRGQQDVVLKQSFGKLGLSHRFQVEERFIRKATATELLQGTTFSWRFRYRISADYTFWKNEKQFLKAIIQDEIMFNGGKNIVRNTFDQNRIYAAMHYGLSKQVAVELGYLKSFQQRASGIDYFDRDIVRFSFFHKIKL